MKFITPQEFQKIERQHHLEIEKLEKQISRAYDLSQKCPFPEHVRPATAKDIKARAIIWYKREKHHGGDYWLEVEEVRYPDDDFKAFIAKGSRYGLHGAFIEVRKAKK